MTDTPGGRICSASVGSGSQTAELNERDAQKLYNNYIEISNHMVDEINDALDQAYLNLYPCKVCQA